MNQRIKGILIINFDVVDMHVNAFPLNNLPF